MLWQVTVASTGLRSEVNLEGRYLDRGRKFYWKKERVFFALLDRTSTGKGQLVDRYPGRLSRLASASTSSSFFGLKTYIFLVISLVTLRQGL